MSRRRERSLLRRHARFLVKAAVSLLMLAIIFYRFNPAEMWRVMKMAHLRFLLMAFGAGVLIFLAKALKWFLLVRQVSNTVPFREAALSLLAGMGFGLVTPSRVGEVARVSYLSVPDKSRFVGLVAVDRLLDLATVILAAAVAISLALNMRAAALVLALPVLVALILLFTPRLPARLVRASAGHAMFPWSKQAHHAADGLALLGGRLLAAIFFLSTLIFAAAVLQFYWLLQSFQAPNSLIAATVSFPVLTLAGVLPFTLAGFGAREGASVVVLSLYNIPEAVAVNAALLSFALNTLLPALFGLLLAPAVSSRPLPTTGNAENR